MAFNFSSIFNLLIFLGLGIIMFKVMGRNTVKTGLDLVLLSIC